MKWKVSVFGVYVGGMSYHLSSIFPTYTAIVYWEYLRLGAGGLFLAGVDQVGYCLHPRTANMGPLLTISYYNNAASRKLTNLRQARNHSPSPLPEGMLHRLLSFRMGHLGLCGSSGEGTFFWIAVSEVGACCHCNQNLSLTIYIACGC